MADIFSRASAVSSVLPLVVQKKSNHPVFHIIKLPQTQDRSPWKVLAEWAIQPLPPTATLPNLSDQACWWTSYIIFAQNGLLGADTGVYDSWAAFASASADGSFMNVLPRSDGIIFHLKKGVANGLHTNVAIADEAVIPRGVPLDAEVYVCLVVATTHGERYQVHGQARMTLDL